MHTRPHHTHPPHHPSHRYAHVHLDAQCQAIAPLHDNYCWRFLSTSCVPGSVLHLLINFSHQFHRLGTFTIPIFQRDKPRHREAKQFTQVLKRWCQRSGAGRLAQSLHTAIVHYGTYNSCISFFTAQFAGAQEAPTETGRSYRAEIEWTCSRLLPFTQLQWQLQG